MKTNLLDTPNRRVSVAATAGALILLLAAGIAWYFLSAPPAPAVNGAKIIEAARAYTKAMAARKVAAQPVVPLQTLIDAGYLKPEDAGGLQGLDAHIFLAAATHPAPLMQVRLPDGADLVLLDDGSIRQVKK